MSWFPPLRGLAKATLTVVYVLGWAATFAWVMFFTGYAYTWSNWPLLMSYSMTFASIWPLYWLWFLLR